MFGQVLERLGLNQNDYEEDEPEAEQQRDATSFRNRATGHQLLLFHPRDIEGLERIVDGARNNYPMLLSLEQTPEELRQRILDYCRGLCAGLGLTLNAVTELVYVLTPEQVPVLPFDEDGFNALDDWLRQDGDHA